MFNTCSWSYDQNCSSKGQRPQTKNSITRKVSNLLTGSSMLARILQAALVSMSLTILAMGIA